MAQGEALALSTRSACLRVDLRAGHGL